MGWVAIPLAVLGLAALSNGGGNEYASYQECSYAPAAYGYQAAPSYNYAQPQQNYEQQYDHGSPQSAVHQSSIHQPQSPVGAGNGYYGGYAGASYTGGGGYGGMSGGTGY